MTVRRWVAALTVATIGATPMEGRGQEMAFTVASTGPVKAWLRIEAVTDDVIRLWYSDSPAHARKPSIAMESAPKRWIPFGRSSAGNSAVFRTARLEVQIDRRTLETSVFDAKTRRRVAGPLTFAKREAERWSLTQRIAPTEHLFGLGEDNRNGGKLDRRGTIRELWAGQQINSGNVTAEYPIPFLLSEDAGGRSYGVFVDNVHRLRYDLGKTKPDEIRLDAEGGEADLYLVNGPAPKRVVSRYTLLTGRPSLPPLWTLGYIQSRCVFYNWGDVDGAYEGLRSRGYPVDALVIDYQWPEFLNDFVWDKRWTVNGVTPARKIKEYRDKGVNLMLYGLSPMVVKDAPSHKTGWDAGVFATDGKGNPVQAGYYNGDLLDFTAPNMNAWLWPQLRPRNLEGLYAWWLDLTEPEGEPPQTVYKGGRPAEIHNQFSILVTRSFEGSLLKDHPDQRPWLLTRAGSAGIGRHHAALWTGDINSDYATLRAHPGEMLNSGISGINAWTCDTGGFLSGFYKDDQFGAHARLYERWMQFSVFSPITRAHKAGLCMPYEFGPATEQGTKRYLNLRYRLLPYIYSHTVEASETGVPIVRAMGIEFPDDPKAIDAPGDQYMFGQNLLVAPVLDEGVANRSVYFPKGTWIDWDTGVEYAGGRTWVVAAPQNRIPVAVRPGAILPMAPEMANTSVVRWDPLTVEVFPRGKSSFTMVQDDGRSFEYRRGASTRTRFDSVERADSVAFSIQASNRLFLPKRYALRFHLDRKPLSVKVDGTIARWDWDAESRVLTTTVAAGAVAKHSVAVTLSPARLPARPAPSLVADKIDAQGEARGGGRPIPRFFPAPVLPRLIRAADYDNGGEGVAFHVARKPATTSYRPDDAGILAGAEPGSQLLGGLQRDDWVRYSIDAGNGGYFDLALRTDGRGALRLLSADRDVIPPTTLPERSGLGETVIRNVYLNPGLDSLMLYVDRPGFRLDSLEFRAPANPPAIYEAEWAARTGQVVVVGPGEGSNGGLGNVGQLAGSVTVGVGAPRSGPVRVRIRYRNGGQPLTFRLSVNEGAPRDVTFPRTEEAAPWRDLELPLPLVEGRNRITLSWKTDKYDSVQLDRFEVLSP